LSELFRRALRSFDSSLELIVDFVNTVGLLFLLSESGDNLGSIFAFSSLGIDNWLFALRSNDLASELVLLVLRLIINIERFENIG